MSEAAGWVAAGACVVALVWARRLAAAMRQRALSEALLALLRRVDKERPALFAAHRELIAAAERASAAKPSELFTPGASLSASLDAARAVMLAMDAVEGDVPENDRTALAALLDAEQDLLAFNKLAFSPEPGSWACRHIRQGGMTETRIRDIIRPLRQHTQGNRAYARSWCRRCLTGFEDQWGIAVSGGH